MRSDAESVLAAAMQLPAEARAALAAELIESLDGEEDPAADVEAAWSDEVRCRLEEVDAGAVTAVPWSKARERILAAAKGRGEAG